MTETFDFTDALATPESSALSNLFYNKNDERLLVVFKHSGDKRVYFDVEPSVWAELTDPFESKGAYYSRFIKPDYSSAPVKDDISFKKVVENSGEVEDISEKAVDALTNDYTIQATLDECPVSFDVASANDVEAVKAFHDYISRLNATGTWKVKAVTRHF